MDYSEPHDSTIHRPSGIASSLVPKNFWSNYSGLFFLVFFCFSALCSATVFFWEIASCFPVEDTASLLAHEGCYTSWFLTCSPHASPGSSLPPHMPYQIPQPPPPTHVPRQVPRPHLPCCVPCSSLILAGLTCPTLCLIPSHLYTPVP